MENLPDDEKLAMQYKEEVTNVIESFKQELISQLNHLSQNSDEGDALKPILDELDLRGTEALKPFLNEVYKFIQYLVESDEADELKEVLHRLYKKNADALVAFCSELHNVMLHLEGSDDVLEPLLQILREKNAESLTPGGKIVITEQVSIKAVADELFEAIQSISECAKIEEIKTDELCKKSSATLAPVLDKIVQVTLMIIRSTEADVLEPILENIYMKYLIAMEPVFDKHVSVIQQVLESPEAESLKAVLDRLLNKSHESFKPILEELCNVIQCKDSHSY